MHRTEEIKNIIITTVHHFEGLDSNLKIPMNYFQKNKKAYTEAGMAEVYEIVLQDEFRRKTKAQREDVRQVKTALEKSQ